MSGVTETRLPLDNPLIFAKMDRRKLRLSAPVGNAIDFGDVAKRAYKFFARNGADLDTIVVQVAETPQGKVWRWEALRKS